MKAQRKPSVLISRKFEISNALKLTPSIKQDESRIGLSEEDAKKQNKLKRIPSKLIDEDGRDVTPLPFIRQDLPSIEDITFRSSSNSRHPNVNNADCDEGESMNDDPATDETSVSDSDSKSEEGALRDRQSRGAVAIPWIPKLMKELALDVKAKLSSPLSMQTQNEIPFYSHEATWSRAENDIRLSASDLIDAFSMQPRCISANADTSTMIQVESPLRRTQEGIEKLLVNGSDQKAEGQNHSENQKASENQELQENSGYHDREVQVECVETVTSSTSAPLPTTNEFGSTCDARCFMDQDRLKINNEENYYATTKDKMEEIVSAIMMTNESLLDVSDGMDIASKVAASAPTISKSTHLLTSTQDKDEVTFQSINLQSLKRKVFASTSILRKLRILEAAVQQNNYRSKQVKYRGVVLAPPRDVDLKNPIGSLKDFPDRHREEESSAGNNASLSTPELLFTFHCSVTAKKAVTCMTWHRLKNDVLAVGYSEDQNDLDKNSQGIVMLWSLRNPSFPERMVKMESAVTAMDYSERTPTILAIGMESGCIRLLDTSQANCSSLNIDTAFTHRRHMSTVTQLLWINDSRQRSTERLVSISLDGRVVQWSVKKGMFLQPLMTLKRSKIESSESKLPSIAMGLCMDFRKGGDSLTYIAGSEDGSLYRCSRSYTEQHLSRIQGHTGPVTKIKMSPVDDTIFLTSSADSTVKLWSFSEKQNDVKEELCIQPTNLWAPVNDISWSPSIATLFALVTASGRVELWDLAHSTLDPVTSIAPFTSSKKVATNERTTVIFTENGNALIIGDERGNSEVYCLSRFLRCTYDAEFHSKENGPTVLKNCLRHN